MSGSQERESFSQRWFLPIPWYIILAFLLVVGIVLVLENPQFQLPVQEISQHLRPDTFWRFIGMWLMSIVVSHLLIFYLMRLVRLKLHLHGNETSPDLYSPAFVGICESILYPGAILLGRAEFIGVWLAIKVAGQWVRWGGGAGSSNSSEPHDEESINEGRRRFNAFLVGNAMSIIAGYVTSIALRIWSRS